MYTRQSFFGTTLYLSNSDSNVLCVNRNVSVSTHVVVIEEALEEMIV